jgi:hypothetical protein
MGASRSVIAQFLASKDEFWTFFSLVLAFGCIFSGKRAQKSGNFLEKQI